MVDAQRKVAYLRRHADLVNKNGLHKTVSRAGSVAYLSGRLGVCSDTVQSVRMEVELGAESVF